MMNNKWRLPHPATMFLLLTLAVIVLSWIFDIYGLSVFQPQTGEEIRVQSLLSPEGVRWLLRHVVTNFTGFAPLGLVIVAMFGIGVAQHSGFIDACIRGGARRKHNLWRMVILVIFLGLLSNVVGDAGYIILLPIAATLFHSQQNTDNSRSQCLVLSVPVIVAFILGLGRYTHKQNHYNISDKVRQ